MNDIVEKAKSYIGQFRDGPDVPKLANEIARVFPELASYCSQADSQTPWCGIFVAYVLSQLGIHPPGVDGRGVGFMYVNRWLDWGESVPVNQRQPGDICLFLTTPHHVNIYVGDNQYVGGNQGDQVTSAHYRNPDAVRRARTVELRAKPTTKLHTGIVATVFGGTADPNTSAYDGHFITDSELGVALPYRFKGDRPKVRVYHGSLSVDCAIVDVGPWNTRDNYWQYNARPLAETGTDTRGRKTNLAGIDLTPAAARAIGLSGKGRVDWQFLENTNETVEVIVTEEINVPAKTTDPNVLVHMMQYFVEHPDEFQRIAAFMAALQGKQVPVEATAQASPPSKLGFGTGLLGLLAAALGWQQGAIGAPVGETATLPGLLSFALPLALSVFGASGGVAPILSRIVSALVVKK